MRLRVRLNLILASLLTIFVVTSLILTLAATRTSVREELAGANSVATRIIRNTTSKYANEGLEAVGKRLSEIGHVRATDIELLDSNGNLIYASPPSRYRAGEKAPDWFAALVTPAIRLREINVANGKILVRASPSRAVLGGWDDFRRNLLIWLTALVVVNGAVYWIAGRALEPIHKIIGGLERLARGDYSVRMPAFRGEEGRLMQQAFNLAAQGVADVTDSRQQALEARMKLQANRDLTREINTHIEDERRQIARELHDELGQSITAIKSIGVALLQRDLVENPEIKSHIQTIVDTADRMYDAVHAIIPRLRPMALDSLGLSAAIPDLIGEWRKRRPGIRFLVKIEKEIPPLDEAISVAAYRIAQESIINAVRHASPRQIAVTIKVLDEWLVLQVADDGIGLDVDWEKSGHFGILGMHERAVAIGGIVEIGRSENMGTAVTARLPLQRSASRA